MPLFLFSFISLPLTFQPSCFSFFLFFFLLGKNPNITIGEAEETPLLNQGSKGARSVPMISSTSSFSCARNTRGACCDSLYLELTHLLKTILLTGRRFQGKIIFSSTKGCQEMKELRDNCHQPLSSAT